MGMNRLWKEERVGKERSKRKRKEEECKVEKIQESSEQKRKCESCKGSKII